MDIQTAQPQLLYSAFAALKAYHAYRRRVSRCEAKLLIALGKQHARSKLQLFCHWKEQARQQIADGHRKHNGLLLQLSFKVLRSDPRLKEGADALTMFYYRFILAKYLRLLRHNHAREVLWDGQAESKVQHRLCALARRLQQRCLNQLKSLKKAEDLQYMQKNQFVLKLLFTRRLARHISFRKTQSLIKSKQLEMLFRRFVRLVRKGKGKKRARPQKVIEESRQASRLKERKKPILLDLVKANKIVQPQEPRELMPERAVKRVQQSKQEVREQINERTLQWRGRQQYREEGQRKRVRQRRAERDRQAKEEHSEEIEHRLLQIEVLKSIQFEGLNPQRDRYIAQSQRQIFKLLSLIKS